MQNNMLNTLKNRIIQGHLAIKKELLQCVKEDLLSVSAVADDLRKRFCGNTFDLCCIINGKSGRCSEDCKYCAQSIRHQTNMRVYPLLSAETILQDAQRQYAAGILRYSVVTSGKRLTEQEVSQLCAIFQKIHAVCPIRLCGSLGLLNEEQLRRLKDAGMSRLHSNLETSRRFFPQVCTTHTYDDKIATLRAAQAVGLEVCSGGIVGLGERMEDRIDMILNLRQLGVKSIPLNVLNPIPGTPFENNIRLKSEEVQRIAAIFRLAIPDAAIRLAGGRGLMPDKGRSIFKAGANAAISGDMLTTVGICASEDMKILSNLDYKVGLLN